MTKNKIKIILLLTFAFIITNGTVYYIEELNKKQRISIALDKNVKDLQRHFEILLHHQKLIANTVYISTTSIPNFLEIFSKLQTASLTQKSILRTELYNLLKRKYNILKINGVLQYHFILPNNESFLRMHKPNKFGDDLTNIREDFNYTNKTKKPIRGFTKGKTTHGFRNIYPIFDSKNNYLGAMEVSFSSDSFQQYLNEVSKIHTHFIINNKIFDTKTWKRDDLNIIYFKSSEHKDFMLTMNAIHTKDKCIIQNNIKLKSIRKEINDGIKVGNKFAVYTQNNSNEIEIISFFPIKDITNTKNLAWLVSYEKSDFIYTTLLGGFIIKTILFLSFLIFVYLIFKQIIIQQKLKQDHRLLNDLLNSTNNIMFVTDFKQVTFSNKKFKYFFGITNENEFNKMINNNMLNIFKNIDGYLNIKLLKKNETFQHLIAKTIPEERLVCILDKSLKEKTFNINITKTSFSDSVNYLVTLTDITKLKEKEIRIQKQAYIDSLTQVFNRNKFEENITQELKRHIRYKRNLSVALIDIDNFKSFNDQHGHLIGDEVLIMLSKNLNQSVRDTDTFARWGGEEFMVLFPETTKDEAKIICEKLRIIVKQLSHPIAGNITASFGLTQYKYNDTLETMFKRCDDALYKAKNTGRNMVCEK